MSAKNQHRVGHQEGEHPLNHTGQLFSFGLFMVIWTADSFFLRQSTFLSGYVSLWVRIVILVLLVGMSVYLFKAVIFAFPADGDHGGIITTGPFRYVRHPLYLACIIFYVGMSLSTLSLASLALVFGVFFFYNHLADYEEQFLLKKYGKQYADYQKKTTRWLPGIW